jgi:hypothetical protein
LPREKRTSLKAHVDRLTLYPIERKLIVRHRTSDQAKIDRSMGEFDRAISNLMEKSADIETIFVRFKIQTQVVRFK